MRIFRLKMPPHRISKTSSNFVCWGLPIQLIQLNTTSSTHVIIKTSLLLSQKLTKYLQKYVFGHYQFVFIKSLQQWRCDVFVEENKEILGDTLAHFFWWQPCVKASVQSHFYLMPSSLETCHPQASPLLLNQMRFDHEKLSRNSSEDVVAGQALWWKIWAQLIPPQPKVSVLAEGDFLENCLSVCISPTLNLNCIVGTES